MNEEITGRFVPSVAARGRSTMSSSRVRAILTPTGQFENLVAAFKVELLFSFLCMCVVVRGETKDMVQRVLLDYRKFRRFLDEQGRPKVVKVL